MNLVTTACGAVLVLGLFLDGWAHSNSKPDSFFTPWHGVLYAGFLATAAWIGWVTLQSATPGTRLQASIPAGYGWGVVGAAGFALGGVADMAWHSAFGVEVDEAALYSPPHLLLMVSGFLVLTTPVRALWVDPTIRRVESWRRLAPALISSLLAMALVAFFFKSRSMFSYRLGWTEVGFWDSLRSGDREYFIMVDHGYFMFSTLVFLAPVLFLLRRWHLPAGFVTVSWTVVAVLLAAVEEFEAGPTVFAALIGGAIADAANALWRPGPDRPHVLRWFAFAIPIVMWSAFMAIAALAWTVEWPAVTVSGIVLLCGVIGVGLSLLTVPPLAPAVDNARERR